MSAEAEFRRSLDEKVNTVISSHVKSMVDNYTLDLQKTVKSRIDEIIEQTIKQAAKKLDFPDGSIRPNSIDWSEFKVSVNSIRGLKTFPGIEDHSESPQIEISDQGIKTTNTVTQSLKVEDSVELPKEFYEELKQLLINEVSELVANAATKTNERINRLFSSGNLQQLDVPGEAALAGETLYASPGTKRVGINTIDPSHTFTVWDQETETVISKHSHNSVFIGTKRSNTVNIGAGGKIGITVDHDRVSIDNLSLMGRVIAQADQIPGYAGNTGDIVLNNKPAPAGYVGWICIEHTRWAPWGKIG